MTQLTQTPYELALIRWAQCTLAQEKAAVDVRNLAMSQGISIEQQREDMKRTIRLLEQMPWQSE